MKKFSFFIISTFLTINIILLGLTAKAINYNPGFEPSSKAIYFINLDTNTEVYAKNPHDRMYPASTTKIMTYLVTIENITNVHNTQVKIKQSVLDELLGTGSSMSNIKGGDVLTVYQLLQCMMIPSGNDAALVLADFVGGGDEQKFIDLMNNKAKELGCEDTHFANPHGLQDPQHYTTAYDLSLITRKAMQDPEFINITNTVQTYYSDDNPDSLLVTTNKMIDKNRGGEYYYPYAKGIKTGHCDDSGYCLISIAVKNGISYLCVALGAPGSDNDIHTEMIDTKKLYQWAFDSLSVKPIASVSKPVAKVKLNYVWNKNSLVLVPAPDAVMVLPKNIDINSLDIIVDDVGVVSAPVIKGQVITSATVYYANQPIGKIDLISNETLKKSNLLFTLGFLYKLLTSKWFMLSLLILLVLVISYVLLIYTHKRNQRKKNKRIMRHRNNIR